MGLIEIFNYSESFDITIVHLCHNNMEQLLLLICQTLNKVTQYQCEVPPPKKPTIKIIIPKMKRSTTK